MTWDPITHPWRVSITRVGADLPHGWATTTETFASEHEARARFSAPFAPNVRDARLDFAENAATWISDGRWRYIDRRSVNAVGQRKPRSRR